MSIKPEIYTDGHRLVMSWARKGRPDFQRIFKDRRMGVSWPGPNNPGYFCLMALQEHPRREDGRVAHRLLNERETTDVEELFKAITIVCKRMKCAWVLADVSKKHDTIYAQFARWLRERSVDYFRLHDASDYGGIEEALSAMNDLIGGPDDPEERNALYVPTTTILGRQLSDINPEDLHLIDKTKVEERFYAAHAMSYVITSWQLYPFRKPQRDSEEYPGRGTGYG